MAEPSPSPGRAAPILREIAGDRSAAVLDRALAAARELLGMDVAYLAAFDDDALVYLKADGDTSQFIGAGGSLPLERTLCKQVVDGRAPQVIADTRAEPGVSDLDVVSGGFVGAYVGVPVTLRDGSVFGTFCCMNREADSSLGERDVQFMHVLARIVADHLEYEQSARRSDKARSDTLARVTHDLRSPLQGILGYAELLRVKAVPEYAQVIVEEVQRLERLLGGLLDEQTPAVVPFDLGALAERQAAVFSRQSAAHELVVERGDDPVLVVGEPGEIGSVVANFLSNAIKYSPGGGLVVVSVATTGSFGRVSVRDEGLGIPPTQARAIFTPFFRVQSAELEAIPGTGLGLALARDAVRAQHGDVGFESIEGHGSTFWCDLPLA